MLAKKSRPVIGILTGSSITGDRFHFDHQISRSPKSPKKNFDLGGVGLGIVAALQSSADDRTDFPPNRSLISRSSNRSKPIPVSPPPNPRGGDRLFEEEMASESSEEEYTIVTRHSQNKSRTEVYGRGGRCDGERSFRTQHGGVFHISPASYGCGGVPAADFLSSCHLCRKKLQGEDIYMYRGEKAFCSEECRYREIVMDERADKCVSKAATRTVDLSSAVYVNGQIFTTGILAI